MKWALPSDPNRVIFMDQGSVEQNEPEAFFNNPLSDRTKLFLSQILGADYCCALKLNPPKICVLGGLF